MPPNQRFDADELAGYHIDLGLIVQDELPTPNCAPEPCFQRDPFRKPLAQDRGVEFYIGCQTALECHFGVAIECLDVGAVLGKQRATRVYVNHNLVLKNRKWPVEDVEAVLS